MSKHSKTPIAERRAAVLELRRAGLSYRAIGEKLGMSGQNAWLLGTGRTGHESRAPKPETVRGYLAKRKREHEAHAALMIRLLGVE